MSERGMTLQVLGGVNLPCSWYRVRGQLPSTGGQEHTHTHALVNTTYVNTVFYLHTYMGDLFKHMFFLEPACDGQHGYQVPLVSIVKKTSVSEQHTPLSPKNLITLTLTLNIARLDLNHQSMSSTKLKPLFEYTPTCPTSKPSQVKDRDLFVVLESSTFLTA